MMHVASGIPVSLETRLAVWEAAGPTGDAAHRARLQTLADTLCAELKAKGELDVLFVCTHNSRRSHMAQLIGFVAARRAGLNGQSAHRCCRGESRSDPA